MQWMQVGDATANADRSVDAQRLILLPRLVAGGAREIAHVANLHTNGSKVRLRQHG